MSKLHCFDKDLKNKINKFLKNYQKKTIPRSFDFLINYFISFASI